MSAREPTTETAFRVKGWHVAVGFTAFFAVVIGVDGTFTVMAIRSHPGQVSVTPYEDGLLYNRHIDQMKVQERLGWRAAAEAQPGLVAMEFRDREGRAIRGLAITARLQRPATDEGSISPRFVETVPGRYEATTGAIAGAWDLTAVARNAEGARFMAERRLAWR